MKIIFGGAFNPIHAEHVNMIKHLLSLEETEKVIVLPSANPPHKKCDTLFSQRVDMIRLALRGVDNVEICDIENKDDGKHYTCEVLPKLKDIYGDIAFVIGGDSLIDFSTWKNPQDVIKICPLYVFTRGADERFEQALEYWRDKGGDIRVCDYHPKDISSTLVRYNIMIARHLLQGNPNSVTTTVAERSHPVISTAVEKSQIDSSVIDARSRRTCSLAMPSHTLLTTQAEKAQSSPCHLDISGEVSSFHFDRSEAERRNLNPSNVILTQAKLSGEIQLFEVLSADVARYIMQNNLYSQYSSIIEKLKSNIPQHTFEHCSRTAQYALSLNYSLSLGIDYDKVLLAGLFHDCAKALCHLPHSTVGVPSDAVSTPVEHQFLGAIVAKEQYGIDDIDVLEAIKYHTTGKKSMENLQKLIFCADMLELGRSYPEVDYLRSCIQKSLDYGYRQCVLAQYDFLREKGGNIYPLTLEAVDDVKY